MTKRFTFYMASDDKGNAVFSVVQGELNNKLANDLKQVNISSKDEKQNVRELFESIIDSFN
ncbi:hypothetical protein QUW45_08605 [Limosilactobacillus pontis]|uniref:hypothetical protein n=1 Tax=Limosilactobacillus pontis TaxID=35787 RepID=UPI0025A3DF49|nr:hypothetical protein [Limosilactobacillus pontis]MDM8332716.1 hypothetical protein [Limosilactobacillus pontis]